MPHLMDYLGKELAELIERHTDREGFQPTEIPFLTFSRYSTPHSSTLNGPPYGLYNPSLCLVAQGAKDVILGDSRFRFGPTNYFVASMDLPIISEVVEASADLPILSCKIEFTPSQILELFSDDDLKRNPRRTSKRSMYVAELDVALLDAVVRLVRLLDSPTDIPVLCPLYTKEILYRILHGEHGDALRQIATDESPTFHIKKAIQHVLCHFQEPLRIETLANIAKMSVPSFHRHFKQITAMSPIQFQKRLRLLEARRLLMSSESDDVAHAAFQVGYESPTQFSREYARMFGYSPRADMKRLKGMN
ncbi:AraC family transcriptional regulator [Alicyclobacillus acidoterrestris]|uniref:AraC family transcriptional regulator n=1 Tax=Alicyclobacillus acidoterrestris (strain ATCC 49025 / DSM 3922 / CIP 106132 / NCIMB 13137 / GD3B) TaxID=1356854 RepID=T0BR54_ALIAG|nr:AraC family transcriptional regulator [Alicyclobacillus acidoterrestris]EPZ43254.1 hypothetical protein N007_13660 [Alicyclobacillus acidoterrestris ATCC 49025]UNO47657.1 AraC family transcriptional regulator [Alicyclobacillus acidoterrestris]